ncbi:MAG TPA: hypothetical protein VM939_15180, partial [Gemmatimonadaceae bacterium]|nr:hypothetical protein [Gemmatimonadaceae bacterium]
RDGQVNRIEYYEQGKLARAEEDTDRNGRVDRWETYAEGALTTLSMDTTGSGTATHTIDYRTDRTAR